MNNEPFHPGIRDYFAAKALQGVAADDGLDAREKAEHCYRLADAMIAVRVAKSDVEGLSYRETLGNGVKVTAVDDLDRSCVRFEYDNGPASTSLEIPSADLKRVIALLSDWAERWGK